MQTSHRTSPRLIPALAVLAAFALATGTAAADETTWKDTAEFSYVLTSGNSETQTLGFKNKLTKGWEMSSFELKAGGIRSEADVIISRIAIGDEKNFKVREETSTRKTAENYYLNGRYNRDITDRFFWFAGAGWDRNEFAGIQNRYTGVGGVGNIWFDGEDLQFRTDYALTYTKQDDVFSDPNFPIDDSFLGVQFSWAYLNQLNGNTTYTNDLVLNLNVDETDDYRADMLNALSVAMNKRLAIKLGLQFLFDNQPSRLQIDLFDDDPASGGSKSSDPASIELDDLDTIFTASLVVNF